MKNIKKMLFPLTFFSIFETQYFIICCFLLIFRVNQNKVDMEGYERKEGMEDREEIYSKAVRAGKRTYFFDVKATRNNDYYLTITESKKKLDTEGNQNFEKHKIFLYKEDFEKFAEGLDKIVEYIKAALSDKVPVAERKEKNEFDVDFDQI